MPTANKILRAPQTGESAEILETSAMTNGAYVRSRIVFKPGALKQFHVHLKQDETIEVVAGRLEYVFRGETKIVTRGERIVLPKGFPHRHYCHGPDETVIIQTMRPGLDFDYLIEQIFGLAAEGKIYGDRTPLVQGLVWLRKARGPFALPGIPVWLQKLAAVVVTPIAYRFGYRAVYKRFSGEEW